MNKKDIRKKREEEEKSLILKTKVIGEKKKKSSNIQSDGTAETSKQIFLFTFVITIYLTVIIEEIRNR